MGAAGQTYTLTDRMAPGSANPLSDYRPEIVCRDTANNDAAVPVTGSNGTWTVGSLTTGQNVV